MSERQPADYHEVTLRASTDRAVPLPEPDAEAEEALQRQLHLARAQGDAYGAAVAQLTSVVPAHGVEQRVGDYWVGYAVEAAQGLYEWIGDRLVWRHSAQSDMHVGITLRDAGDGRFIPGAGVVVSLIDPDGNDLGTHAHPLVWHPMLYRYGRDWYFPVDGRYTMRVRIEPPRFMRHDELNGNRISTPADCEFTDVDINRSI